MLHYLKARLRKTKLLILKGKKLCFEIGLSLILIFFALEYWHKSSSTNLFANPSIGLNKCNFKNNLLSFDVSVSGIIAYSEFKHLKERDMHSMVERVARYAFRPLLDQKIYLDSQPPNLKVSNLTQISNFNGLREKNLRAKKLYFEIKYRAAACTKPKQLNWNIKVPRLELEKEALNEIIRIGSCFWPEFYKMRHRDASWYFWRPENKGCQSNNKNFQELSISLKPRNSPSRSQVTATNPRDGVFWVIGHETSTPTNKFNFKKIRSLAANAANLKTNINLKKFLAEKNLNNSSLSTFLISLWSISHVLDDKKIEFTTGQSFVTATWSGGQLGNISISYVDGLNLNSKSLPIALTPLKKSTLVIYTGHSNFGENKLVSNLIKSSASNKKTKLVAIFSCHSYSYFHSAMSRPRLKVIYTMGELFDYEGRLGVSLVLDYLFPTDSNFYSLVKSNPAGYQLSIIN